ncbi:protein transport protein Sec24A isoform X2 [Daktulosphaira vitifoliae]|uniref:protein transport protein Sec24A isoform X2 n=1 Tax=Daktulosphaira vitifoliae TaxID=58002 RepID=UPI0021AA106E|nr:protein transport protein Sec24A isoform X2 [Daktulosphaira vitifoliae]
MEQNSRYNYFHQNHSQPLDEKFREPMINHNYYQNENSQSLSLGSPGTTVKRLPENSQSIVPDVIRLAQKNSENYSNNPDYQLQPHLTGLLTQQPKHIQEIQPVDKHSSFSGSISANMKTNYFAVKPPYPPEPKIIEYDMDETSTESSPQHTSSLYSESTDQESESVPTKPLYPQSTNLQYVDTHVSKEFNSSIPLNKKFPVPSEFADLDINKDENVDDHQSILQNAYNQNDDDIEDIPIPMNLNEHSNLESQKNLEIQYVNNNDHKTEKLETISSKSNNINLVLPNNDSKLLYEDGDQPFSYFNNIAFFNQSTTTNQSNIDNSYTKTLPNTTVMNFELSDTHQKNLKSTEFHQSTKLSPKLTINTEMKKDRTLQNNSIINKLSDTFQKINSDNTNNATMQNDNILCNNVLSNSLESVNHDLSKDVQSKSDHKVIQQFCPNSVQSNISSTSDVTPSIKPSNSLLFQNKVPQSNQTTFSKKFSDDQSNKLFFENKENNSDSPMFTNPILTDSINKQRNHQEIIKLEDFKVDNSYPIENESILHDNLKLTSTTNNQSNKFYMSNITSQSNISNLPTDQRINYTNSTESQMTTESNNIQQQHLLKTSQYFNSDGGKNQMFYQNSPNVSSITDNLNIKTQVIPSSFSQTADNVACLKYNSENSLSETLPNISSQIPTNELNKSISPIDSTNSSNLSNTIPDKLHSTNFSRDLSISDKSNTIVTQNQSELCITTLNASSPPKTTQSFFNPLNDCDTLSITSFNTSIPNSTLQTTSVATSIPINIQSNSSEIKSLCSSISSNNEPLNNQTHSSAFQNISSQINSLSLQSQGAFKPQVNKLTIKAAQTAINQSTSQVLNSRQNMNPTQITNQYPIKQFDNQFKPIGIPPVQSLVNNITLQPLNNVPILSNTNSTTQAESINYTSNVYNSFPKPSNMLSGSNLISQQNSNPTKNVNAQSISESLFQNSFQSDINQFKPIGTQLTQPAINHSLQVLSNQPNSNTFESKQSTMAQNSSYQSKLSNMPSVQTDANYHPQLLSNQSSLFNVPPPQSGLNQFTPQSLNNQFKSIEKSSIQPIMPVPSLNNQIFKSPISAAPSTLNSFIPINSQTTLVNSSSAALVINQNVPLINNKSKPSGILPVQSPKNLYSQQPHLNRNQPEINSMSAAQLPVNNYPMQSSINKLKESQFIVSSNDNILHSQYSAPQKLNIQEPSHLRTNQSTLLPQPIINTKYPNQIISNVNSQPLSSNSQLSQSNNLGMSFNLPPTIQSHQHQTQPTSYNQVQSYNQMPLVYPSQNVTSKGFSQQTNLSCSGEMSYRQLNNCQGQDYYNQGNNPSVIQQGFSGTWGYDTVDLLKTRDILQGERVQPPKIKLPQGYANCDNCSPDIFRCTLNKFPSSKTLLDKSRLPLGILIHPYKDLSRLTVIQCETITRCRNCRSYINPFVQFIDSGHWKCNLCYRVNDLPGEFQIDPYTKTLGDPSRRPEIQNATIEYIASQDYMVRPPQPALYLFLLDVSRLATLTGYLEIVCDRIMNKIMSNDIPGDSRTNIGFITYDSSVHFYQIPSNEGGRPKQLVVSDINDIFLPLPDGLMVNLEENKAAIKDLLTNLPNQFSESFNTGCALGAALQIAFKILAPRGGRVTVFQASLPNCGPGSLQPRDDGSPHSGDRVLHMAPSTDFYKKLALECSAEQIAVDLFFISNQYLDIASISGISKFSAGCIHNFTQFDKKSPSIVTRFINCFDRYLSRKIGFEALLRLRCTRGVAVHSFHGNFFVRSSDLLMLPNVNPDNAYGMQLSIEDNLDGLSVVCFQAALLYTSSNAERRIRVHTMCIPVTDNLNDIFQYADQQAITCLIAKMAVDRSTEKSLSDAREAFVNAISDSLSAYKTGCNSVSTSGSILAPIALKLFPLYILATLKHIAFRTNQPTRLDDRTFSMCQMKSLPLYSLMQFIYPNLYPIHTLEEQPKTNYEKLTDVPLPPLLQLSAERIDSNGIYLMDDSETLIILIGHKCSEQLVNKLFGYVNLNSMPELTTQIAEINSNVSYLLRTFISYIQHFKPYPLPIEIIKDNGPHKLRFFSRLVEDKFESTMSYYEFLQRLSQQIR